MSSAGFSSDDIHDLLSKITKLEENYRLKQMELNTEIEKHKKTTNELENLKNEVSVLLEEKIKLCEKIGTLTESCAVKDHSNEVMKKDLEKRMTELRVLEKRLEEESEAYRKKRELFKQRLEVINEQYKRLLKGCDVQETVQLIDIEEKEEKKEDTNLEYQEVLKDRKEKEQALQILQHELDELSEYVNKLEPNYNQCLEYISHLESIMSECEKCSKARELLLKQ